MRILVIIISFMSCDFIQETKFFIRFIMIHMLNLLLVFISILKNILVIFVFIAFCSFECLEI